MRLSTIIVIVFILLIIPISLIQLKVPLFVILNVPSIIIVIGGSFSAAILAYGYKTSRTALQNAHRAFLNSEVDIVKESQNFIQLSIQSRKHGLLSLDKELKEIQDPFLKKGLELVIDGTDVDVIRDILDMEQKNILERHTQIQNWWHFIVNIAPGFGLIGTIIGILATLRNLGGDPLLISVGLSSAIITTLFGSFISNAIALPIVSNLEEKTNNEITYKKLVIEVIVSIQSGENPRFLKERITSFLPKKEANRISKNPLI